MPDVRVMLLRKGAEPLSVEFRYDERDLSNGITDNMLSISVGEPSANAIVTLPLDLLTLLMGRVMAKTGSQGIVAPKPPSIIMPN